MTTDRRLKLTTRQLAEFVLHTYRARGITVDDLCRVGRARFMQTHIAERDAKPERWLHVVAPTDDEISAMYDELLLLFALTPSMQH